MYLVDALNVMVRRWYVVLAGVVFLAAGAALVIKFVPTTYQASGQMVLLLPPGASGTESRSVPGSTSRRASPQLLRWSPAQLRRRTSRRP